jgi:hypothetical protein
LLLAVAVAAAEVLALAAAAPFQDKVVAVLAQG